MSLWKMKHDKMFKVRFFFFKKEKKRKTKKNHRSRWQTKR